MDLSTCDLDESSASALFQMIEYYEAATELDISNNPNGMTSRGWASCNSMVGHNRELQVLNAHGNPISVTGATTLGHSLSSSNVHTIKLEHCGLRGRPFSSLCFKLRQNRIMKELWLAYNDLDHHDADSLADLLKVNHYLEFVDISNNNIKDDGLRLIVQALIWQSRELEKRSMLQRTTAIDDDDCFSADESSSGPMLESQSVGGDRGEKSTTDATTSLDEDLTLPANNIIEESSAEIVIAEKAEPNSLLTLELESKTELVQTAGGHCSIVNTANAALTHTDLDGDADEDTENTVQSCTIKNSAQSATTTAPQSMLDKLLSMNSDSSSDDGASQLSTDTIAAFSEDTSIISDDIFDSIATNTTNTTSTSTKAATANVESTTLTSFVAAVAPTTVISTNSSLSLLSSNEQLLIETKSTKQAENEEILSSCGE